MKWSILAIILLLVADLAYANRDNIRVPLPWPVHLAWSRRAFEMHWWLPCTRTKQKILSLGKIYYDSEGFLNIEGLVVADGPIIVEGASNFDRRVLICGYTVEELQAMAQTAHH